MKKPSTLQLREKLGLSRSVFARLLKVSENTIFRWDMGKVRPDPLSKAKLENLAEICALYQAAAPGTDVAAWLEKPHGDLENFRPVDLIDSEYGRRRLHQMIERMGRGRQLSLPIRRTLAEYQEKVFPKMLQEIQAAAGFAIPVEVHWEELAQHGRPLEQYAESYDKGLFIPLIAALKTITKDAMGKQALRAGLTKIVIAEKTRKATMSYEFHDGTLKISSNPATFFKEVERHTEELRQVLESNL